MSRSVLPGDDPTGDDAGWGAMWDAFHQVLEADPQSRATLLERLEPDLRQQVESLLEAHRQADDGFPASPVERVGVAPPDALLGRRVGPYRVRQLLGEGGMGSVYVAEQEEPVRRLVALKVIKLGMDSREILARFESERQALVMMNHPNIASAYDAGVTDDGRPYFAMEYVAGRPVDEHCDRHRLTLLERLELFGRVCRGVHHAHRKGIVHRDLKPSNVLVAVIDGEAVPKVIDFGIAKATRQRLTERTLFTQVGMLIGTPEYMSPEQADLGRMEADPRSDVYSLGVVLYRLLVGALPFDSRTLRESGYGEIRRVLVEDDPPLASARLKALGDEAEQVARARRTTPQRLARELREDLDWIAARAMEKDPTRRYASAADLAADVDRYLSNRPVLAGPRTPGYRLKRLARRYRRQVRTAAVFLVLLFGLSLGFTVMSARLGPSERPAEAARGEIGDLLARIAAADGPKTVSLTLGGLPHSNDGLSLAALRSLTTKLQAEIRRRAVPVVGFVNEGQLFVDGEVDERIAILKSWIEAGVDLGNRTYAHTSLCQVSAPVFVDDVIRGDTVSRRLMSEAGRNLSYFAYPFLCTGRDLDSRRRVEAFLEDQGYTVAPVTLENSDYLFGNAYRRFLEAGDKAKAAEVAEAYLEFSDEIFSFYENASDAILGRQARHILQVEATQLNADYISRFLDLLERRGYRFVSLEESLNDPAYALPDDSFGSVGRFWLHRFMPYAKQDVYWSREPIPPEWIRKAAEEF